MNAKERLQQIVDRQRNGTLSMQDKEDFAIINRKIKTSSFEAFCKAIRPSYKWAWFHKYIQQRVGEAFRKRKGRFVAKMPQQHGKTELYGRCAIAYAFGKYPEYKILYLTYSDNRAKEVAADALKLVTTREYMELFPNVKLKDEVEQDVRTATKRASKLSIANFTNVNSIRGEFKAAGIDGSYNGYDANIIILDDFFSGFEQANSQTIRDSRWNAFVNNVLTRQQKECIILVMSTQWHSDDVIGRLEAYMETIPEGAPKWECIQFNALKDERDYPYDPRQVGEYLWPEERMDVYLEKKALDPLGWNTTYQNVPPSLKGNIFDMTCFRIYDVMPNPENMRIIISVDPNYKKDSKEGDPCAIAVYGISGLDVYLFEFTVIKKVSVLDNVARIKYYISKYPKYHMVLVEDKGQGDSIDTLLRDQGIGRVIMFMPNIPKVLRAQYMLPYCHAGQFHIPSGNVKDRQGNYLCPEIQKYINEFMSFTGFKGGHDDLVDTATQLFMACDYLLKPAFLEQLKYTIPNKYEGGKGLTRISNPLGGLGHGRQNRQYR